MLHAMPDALTLTMKEYSVAMACRYVDMCGVGDVIRLLGFESRCDKKRISECWVRYGDSRLSLYAAVPVQYSACAMQ